MTEISLKLDHLECERDERVLFTDLSTSIFGGEIVQVAGPNGAGKTSLLKLIVGLSTDYSGAILWCGKPAPSYSFYSSLLYLGHFPAVKAALTPVENLRWYFGLNGLKKRGENGKQMDKLSSDFLAGVLEKVNLAGYDDVPCYQMSAGQQRRVALARLYISDAPLWVLDEPFTAIDKAGVESLEQCLIQHISKGNIVIFTTHQAPSVPELKVLDLADYMHKKVASGKGGE